ncbi:DoxX family protein [Sphingobacterium hungaricum]|uniref:DoxX family protein n=1 Tax=Sphingobacterium hungaricum TaxID=2082723 RepID=A0A928YQ39_9SPHI|nr:DoxX family membrane protein [Sphingobacterium hungaricum]MBE8712590.1 DoxX family protein [Sphingobacterium hungaricum]
MNTLILRIAVAVIMLAHSIPSLVTGSVNDFGNGYLNSQGFEPIGLYLAWLIKLSHIACAILLMMNKWVKPICIITILILIAGIAMIHFQEGWFVVGGGRNGMEFNFLLIAVLLSIMYPNGWSKEKGAE